MLVPATQRGRVEPPGPRMDGGARPATRTGIRRVRGLRPYRGHGACTGVLVIQSEPSSPPSIRGGAARLAPGRRSAGAPRGRRTPGIRIGATVRRGLGCHCGSGVCPRRRRRPGTRARCREPGPQDYRAVRGGRRYRHGCQGPEPGLSERPQPEVGDGHRTACHEDLTPETVAAMTAETRSQVAAIALGETAESSTQARRRSAGTWLHIGTTSMRLDRRVSRADWRGHGGGRPTPRCRTHGPPSLRAFPSTQPDAAATAYWPPDTDAMPTQH
jgi:hypothetical protein